MVVEFVDECSSTHLELCDLLRKNLINPPFAICAKVQKNGVGSRGNSWDSMEGNLFLSFCLDKNELPKDLNDASVSIYFSMIMQEFLEEKGSKVWIKWPNDFYINEQKIGGTISTKIGQIYVGSIGLNLVLAPQNRGILDLKLDINSIVWGFFDNIDKKKSWKQIFSKFKIQFAKSKQFITHINGKSICLKDAELLSDGAIKINDKKVYSLR